jgi:hypothetical protein
MYCWSCGTRCADEARYCTACGGRPDPGGGRAPDPVADASATDGAPNGRERGTSGRLEAPARPVLRPARAPFSWGRVPGPSPRLPVVRVPRRGDSLLSPRRKPGPPGSGYPLHLRRRGRGLLAPQAFRPGVSVVRPGMGAFPPPGRGRPRRAGGGEEATGSRGDHALVPSGVQGPTRACEGPRSGAASERGWRSKVFRGGPWTGGAPPPRDRCRPAHPGGGGGGRGSSDSVGAMTFAWGWRSLQARRQAVLQRMQRDVIRIARARGGASPPPTWPPKWTCPFRRQNGSCSPSTTGSGYLGRHRGGDPVFDFRELRLGSGEGVGVSPGRACPEPGAPRRAARGSPGQDHGGPDPLKRRKAPRPGGARHEPAPPPGRGSSTPRSVRFRGDAPPGTRGRS